MSDTSDRESPESDGLCYACGGPVGHDGKYSDGGMVKGNSASGGKDGGMPKDDKGFNGGAAFDQFAMALKRRIKGV